MRYFRERSLFVWLGLLAIAGQIVLTFGHLHAAHEDGVRKLATKTIKAIHATGRLRNQSATIDYPLYIGTAVLTFAFHRPYERFLVMRVFGFAGVVIQTVAALVLA